MTMRIKHTRSILVGALRGAALALVALSGVVGCGRPFTAATPPGFVDIGDRYGSDEYRATTADGMVLGIRYFENDPVAEMPFLIRAIENQMKTGGGYALLDKREVRARNGLPGTQLRFGHDEGDDPHLYIVTIFANEDDVFLLEAGGTKELVTRHQAQIDWSVANFLPE